MSINTWVVMRYSLARAAGSRSMVLPDESPNDEVMIPVEMAIPAITHQLVAIVSLLIAVLRHYHAPFPARARATMRARSRREVAVFWLMGSSGANVLTAHHRATAIKTSSTFQRHLVGRDSYPSVFLRR
jgi:hypothetical protein